MTYDDGFVRYCGKEYDALWRSFSDFFQRSVRFISGVRSCSRALNALCYVLLVASISLILGPHIFEFRPSMVGFRGLCQRKPMYFMLFNFGLRIEGVCVGIFEYLEITQKTFW